MAGPLKFDLDDGSEIAVHVAGPEGGTVVLLLHGIPGSARSWDAVRDGLVSAGFRVLAPDLLGFGASARPAAVAALWIDAQVRALATVLTRMDVASCAVAGHDYGAPIAVTLAAEHPERVGALVLAAGNLFTDTPVPLPLRALRIPVLGRAIARLALSGPALRLMLRFGAGRPRPALDARAYLGDRLQRRAIRAIFATALRELGPRYAPVEAALPRLRVPTVVLWGDRDPFFALTEGRRAAAAVSGATLEVARGAGHFLPAERPQLFVQSIRGLVARDVVR